MTRVLSYNILYGGTGRVNELTKIIRSVQPDVVGLIEATDPDVVEELAERLGMQHRITARGEHARDYQIAVLSRLPIVASQAYVQPNILSRPLLEVCVEEADGQQLTVFVAHLSAAFNKGRGGNSIRQREVREILRIMAPKQDTPHLLIGDFNTLAPGDPFKGSALLRYMLNPHLQHKQDLEAMEGHPSLNFVVPPPLRVFNPLLQVIPRSKLLCAVFDAAASVYVPRGSIGLLSNAGYVDCFRRMNPRSWGFTCPAASPAGRIDFIFASPHLARRLAACYVVTTGEGLPADAASDHFPVFAEFGEV